MEKLYLVTPSPSFSALAIVCNENEDSILSEITSITKNGPKKKKNRRRKLSLFNKFL